TPGTDQMTNDPITAVLQQLADHHDQLTQLTELIAGIGDTLREHQAALETLAQSSPADPDGYHPGPPPNCCKLAAADRPQPIARLHAWVEQVYRPGYGHLAATLAPCWSSHDLCLYGLDILSDLWSVLYLQPERTPRTCPPKPNTRPASCPPWPPSWSPRPPAAATPCPTCAGPHDPLHPPPGPVL